MAVYGEMPMGWRLHNVSIGGEPSFIKTFEVERDPASLAAIAKARAQNRFVQDAGPTMKRKVMVALNPFSGKWFWTTTGTIADAGKGDGMEYDDPVAAAVVCEMTFGSTKTYEPVRRNEQWQEGTL